MTPFVDSLPPRTARCGRAVGGAAVRAPRDTHHRALPLRLER
jgi:hypothetical protein